MDNLHPLESKVLLALAPQPGSPCTLDQLAESTGLEPSQLSMAVEWLLAKSLIAVHAETVAYIASLTPVGEVFFEHDYAAAITALRAGHVPPPRTNRIAAAQR